jgi:hypothetical protein
MNDATSTKQPRNSVRALPPVLAIIMLLLANCSQGPIAASYRINFGNVQNAVATEFVETFVFNAKGIEKTICKDIIDTKRNGGELAKALSQSPKAQTPCELIANVTAEVPVEFGSRAIVVVGKRQGSDFLIGCTAQEIGPDQPVAVVKLERVVPDDPDPDTKCTSLVDYCGGGCK